MEPASRISGPSTAAERAVDGFFGDLDRLVSTVGLEGGLLAEGEGLEVLATKNVSDVASLRRFLDAYLELLMEPIELPTITRAAEYTRQGGFNELMTLDRELRQCRALAGFSEASQWIGQCHARSMRGMKDHRAVWRYCDAIRKREAKGWHTVVYGVVLAAYSIPLRQGLQNYCLQTLGGFVDAAARRFQWESEQIKLEKAAFETRVCTVVNQVAEKDGPAQQLQLV